jgi:hypothetical protein
VIGTLWLIGWGFVDGIRVMTDGVMAPFNGWTAAVVLAGVGQVLAGSLAYLVPVLQGSPFEANRHLMEQRPWLPLLALNAAAVALAAGLSTAAVILAAVCRRGESKFKRNRSGRRSIPTEVSAGRFQAPMKDPDR